MSTTIARTTLRLFTSTLLASAALVMGTGPIGCGDEGSGTTGKRIALEVKVAASPESKQFTNAQGWTVSITKAALATGAFYFYDGETLFAGRAPATWAFVKSAFAHPGHYVAGNAKGELLTSSSANLLVGGVLGSGDGVSGFARSATFAFGAPGSGPMAAELGANVAVLEGTATKGTETRSFRVEIAPDEVKDSKGSTQIEGCPFLPADMQSDGVVTLTVKLPLWLDQVAFDDVPVTTDGKPVLLGPGLARNQLVRGSKAGLAYLFSYTPR